jgi:Fe-S cluster biogenesis protein NfuA
MKERVQAALNKIRPLLKADGGDIELVEVTAEGEVKVKLTGACGGCPFAQMTLQQRVATAIKKEVPEIKNVVAAK